MATIKFDDWIPEPEMSFSYIKRVSNKSGSVRILFLPSIFSPSNEYRWNAYFVGSLCELHDTFYKYYTDIYLEENQVQDMKDYVDSFLNRMNEKGLIPFL